MKNAIRNLLIIVPLLCAQELVAQTQSLRQDPTVIRESIESFLTNQTADLKGQVTVSVGQIDTRTNLVQCPSLEPFMPTGSRAWGKTTVGVRCLAPSPWTIYVQVNVTVIGDYFAAAMQIPSGQTIDASHLVKMNGNLTTLPASVITESAQAIGRISIGPIQSGAAVRLDTLRAQVAVQQGQSVRLVSSGPGFRVSSEARAMANANDGQMVQVKTQSGQQLSGIAKIGGTVEITY